MSLADELERIARAAAGFARPHEHVAGVVPVEPDRKRLYLCAFGTAAGDGTWLVLDGDGGPVHERQLVRDAASIAALCEWAEESATGGDLDDLRSRLVALRITENPRGIDEAEEAVAALQAEIGAPPQVATPVRLDALGAATRRLEVALGSSGSPFAVAMRQAGAAVQAFVADVEARYKEPLA
ncbi:MAG: hypothetical protein ABR583_00235 [Gaiellaceae bacterium]